MTLMYYDERDDEWKNFDEATIEDLKDIYSENESFTLEFRFLDLDS